MNIISRKTHSRHRRRWWHYVYAPKSYYLCVHMILVKRRYPVITSYDKRFLCFVSVRTFGMQRDEDGRRRAWLTFFYCMLLEFFLPIYYYYYLTFIYLHTCFIITISIFFYLLISSVIVSLIAFFLYYHYHYYSILFSEEHLFLIPTIISSLWFPFLLYNHKVYSNLFSWKSHKRSMNSVPHTMPWQLNNFSQVCIFGSALSQRWFDVMRRKWRWFDADQMLRA